MVICSRDVASQDVGKFIIFANEKIDDIHKKITSSGVKSKLPIVLIYEMGRPHQVSSGKERRVMTSCSSKKETNQ